MKEFCLAEENLTTEFFVFLFFPYFPLFPLDGAIPVNLDSYVLHCTALYGSDTKQEFTVKP